MAEKYVHHVTQQRLRRDRTAEQEISCMKHTVEIATQRMNQRAEQSTRMGVQTGTTLQEDHHLKLDITLERQVGVSMKGCLNTHMMQNDSLKVHT